MKSWHIDTKIWIEKKLLIKEKKYIEQQILETGIFIPN